MSSPTNETERASLVDGSLDTHPVVEKPRRRVPRKKKLNGVIKVTTPEDPLQAFLDVVTCKDLPEDVAHVFCVKSTPGSGGGWPPTSQKSAVRSAGGRRAGKCGFYMSTMTAKANEEGQYRNQQAQFHSLFAVVLDDIGTKVDPNKVKPTAIIESSEGNFQWLYMLSVALGDLEYARRFVSAIYETDLTDGGGNLANKFVRIPAGINAKQLKGEGGELLVDDDGEPIKNDFKVTLVELNADVSYTAEELLDAFGVELAETVDELSSVATALTADTTGGDVVEDWLVDNGYLLDKEVNGNITEFKCPWGHEHGKGGGIAAGYSGLGRGAGSFQNSRQWSCFHGSCKGRAIREFLAWVAEQGGPDASKDVVGDNKEWLLANIVTLPDGSFYDLSEMQSMTAKGLESTYGWRRVAYMDLNGKERLMPPAKVLGLTRKKMTAVGLCWQPVRPDQYAAIIEFDGSRMVNTFVPMSLELVQGNVDDWLELVRHICGEHAEVVLDHMAYTVQFPDRKINWQVLVVGKTRTGKTMMFKPMINGLGSMAHTVSGEELKKAWGNMFARHKAILIEEVFEYDAAVFNSLKPKLANSNIEHLDIKTQGMLVQQNLYSIYMLTNHDNAVRMNEDEDKLLVIRGPDEPIYGKDTDESEAFYTKLGDQIETCEYQSNVLHFLMHRDISQFKKGALPVRTEALYAMCKAARPDYAHYLEHLVESELVPFDKVVVEFEDVRQELRESGYKGGHNGIQKALLELGFVSCVAQRKVDGKNNQKCFWVRAGMVEGLSARELHDFYFKNQAVTLRAFEARK